jgi:protocatechuate 3,4-dioxygenase, alpha subunit
MRTVTEQSMGMGMGLTPSQTVGPFLSIGLPWPDGPDVVPEGTPAAIRLSGRVYDGEGAPVTDALVETWQADALGHFVHPDDPRGTTSPTPYGFRGFGRCATDEEGRWHVVTVKPGSLPAPAARWEAPHIDVSVFARGLLDRVVTRIYFPGDESAHQTDPVLETVEPARRSTLIAERGGSAQEFHFDIHLRGTGETVFFDV